MCIFSFGEHIAMLGCWLLTQ